jgi:hypothetical protein
MKTFRPQLSYSSVVATIALFLALGGTVYAASQLPKNSVGPKQLRKDAVVSSKVKKGSLLPSDFKAGLLPHGPQGPAGQRGPAGAQGPAGPQGSPGAQGPGAVKLFFDAGTDNKVVALGAIGPWTLSAQCIAQSGAVPAPFKIFANGPGNADLTVTSQFNGGAASIEHRHVDLSSEDEIFSLGIKSGEQLRATGTMILSARPTDPVVTVPFTLVSDPAVPRCSFVGNAVPAA